jgi:biopolymer transport protein ExbD
MRFSETSGPQKPAFPMAAMTDILFLLLLFYMVTSLFGKVEAELNITLPKSREARDIEREPSEIIINVKADGSYVINQIAYDENQIDEILRALAKVYRGDHIIVRGDKEAKYDYIIRLLDLCKKYSIWNISFAVHRQEPSGARAP